MVTEDPGESIDVIAHQPVDPSRDQLLHIASIVHRPDMHRHPDALCGTDQIQGTATAPDLGACEHFRYLQHIHVREIDVSTS
jgi:hypothetical protein